MNQANISQLNNCTSNKNVTFSKKNTQIENTLYKNCLSLR